MKQGSAINLEKNYIARQSLWILIGKILFAEMIFAVFFVFTNYSFDNKNFLIPLFLSFLNILIIIALFLMWFYRFYVVSPQGISVNRGVIFKRSRTCDFSSIASLEVNQGLISRIFKMGDIRIENPLLKKDLCLKNISNPYKHAEIIEKQRLKELTSTESTKVVPLIDRAA